MPVWFTNVSVELSLQSMKSCKTLWAFSTMMTCVVKPAMAANERGKYQSPEVWCIVLRYGPGDMHCEHVGNVLTSNQLDFLQSKPGRQTVTQFLSLQPKHVHPLLYTLLANDEFVCMFSVNFRAFPPFVCATNHLKLWTHSTSYTLEQDMFVWMAISATYNCNYPTMSANWTYCDKYFFNPCTCSIHPFYNTCNVCSVYVCV